MSLKAFHVGIDRDIKWISAQAQNGKRTNLVKQWNVRPFAKFRLKVTPHFGRAHNH